MNRRDAIKRTSLLLGGALSASVVAGFMSGCQAPTDPDWTPSYLTRSQSETVAEIAECIIPRTDTPGAKDALVHRFIDVYLKDCETAENQLSFITGLENIDKNADASFGKSFVKLSDQEKTDLLSRMDSGGGEKSDQELASELANEGEDVIGGKMDAEKFFASMKELTILGYFSSEVGAKEALVFDQIPGDYLGCIPYEDVGGAWAI